MCSFLYELLSRYQSIQHYLTVHLSSITHNDIDSFVQVDDFAFAIDNRDGTDTTFREHVDDIKHGGLERSGSEWVQRVAFRLFICRVDIASDPAISNTASEVLCNIPALRVSAKVNS